MNLTDQKITSFEPGSPPAEGEIPLCVPEIRGNEWQYIKECLDTNWVSSVGQYVDRFELELASYVGTEYAVATSNGSSALHIALLVAGVQPDDEVLVSALTFIAPVNAIRYVGAWPVFIDSESDYWQMNPDDVVDFLEHSCQWRNGALFNTNTGRRVKAIIPVHILGHPVNMDPIMEVARKYNLVIIEDATESLGAKYKNTMVGRLGDIACFSFNGNKIITTGSGGMIVTDKEIWAKKAKYLTTQAKDDPVEYVHKEIGYNYRLSNIQAAMGVAQMEHLDDYIDKKRRIAAVYTELLTDVPGLFPMVEGRWAFSTFWLYTVLINRNEYGIDSRALMQKLQMLGIQTRPLWQPAHLSPAYSDINQRNCPVAENLNQIALSLPCSVGITYAEQQKVVDTIKQLSI